MGHAELFLRSTLIVGTLAPHPIPSVKNDLSRLLGDIVGESPLIQFNHSDYYESEMGAPLYRQWVAIQNRTPQDLSWSKTVTQVIESTYCVDGRRGINIDPGVLYPHNFILLTTKNFAHRIPIKDGIYGEIELQYVGKQWRPMPWTYPDYASEPFIRFIHKMRNLLLLTTK